MGARKLSTLFLALTCLLPTICHSQGINGTTYLTAVPSISNRIDASVAQDPRFDPQISSQVSLSIMEFARDISLHLAKNTESKSQIFSPVCLSAALALLLLGANGETYNDITRLFRFDSRELLSRPYKTHEEMGLLLEDLTENLINPSRPRLLPFWTTTLMEDVKTRHKQLNTPEDHIIRVSNGLFVQDGYDIRREYKRAAESVYLSEVVPLDFAGHSRQSRDHINNWINEKTFGKIPSIISDDIESNTNVILASTLYFKGFWENSFFGSSTIEANFYPDGPKGRIIKTKMMGNGGIFPYYDAPEYNCRIIGFPYKGNLTTMYIIQPYNSSRELVQALQQDLTPEKINFMIDKMVRKTAVLLFPKMHISNTVYLKKILNEMGVQHVFKNGVADLSLMADGKQPEPQRAAAHAPPAAAANIPQRVDDIFNRVPTVFEQYHYANKLLGLPYENNTKKEVEPFFVVRIGGTEDEGDSQNKTEVSKNETAHSETEATKASRNLRYKRAVKYKVESEFKRNSQPLRLKDLILHKHITKANPGKKLLRSRRQLESSLQQLDSIRKNQYLANPGLFVDDILHKIDLVINEQGTEAAAATVTYLRRSGTDITFRADTPFIMLIRHDPTKLPLFYGPVYEPTT